jgi:hypothetical protein
MLRVENRDKPILLALLALTFSLWLTAGVSFAEAPKQPNQAQCAAAADKQRICPHLPEPGFWERTVSDPINAYTAVMAMFTIVLAATSGWQGWLTRQTINLAREEFEASHRPKLEVKFARNLGGDVEITVINTGDTAANFIEGRAMIVHVDALATVPSPHDLGPELSFTLRNRFGPSVADRVRIPADDEAIFASAAGSAICIFGWIVYVPDVAGATRRTSFFGLRENTDRAFMEAIPGSDWNFIQ